jgi:hypothetical protein
VFNIFRNSKNISEELILNHGYKLALEFGKDWLQPDNERLRKKYPNLSNKDLVKINAHVERLRSEASEFIYQRLEELTNDRKKISEKDLKIELNDWMINNHPWVSNENVKRTLTQGIYFAWKDGLTECIK